MREPPMPDPSDRAAIRSLLAAHRALIESHRALCEAMEKALPAAEPGFLPTDFQRDILAALKGKALRRRTLRGHAGQRGIR